MVLLFLLYKIGSLPETSALLLMINLRNRVEPPLPTLIGNIISFFIATSTTKEQRDMELWDIVVDMKRNLQEFVKSSQKITKLKNGGVFTNYMPKNQWRN